MIIELGFWVIPLLITFGAFGWALSNRDTGGGYLSGIGDIFFYGAAIIISLSTWVIYLAIY